ncbi:MAG: manganese transport protein, partial [Bacteroidia bacterium]
MKDSREELAQLEALDAKSFLPRTLGYMRHIGPGYMQSAMTLGGGTAFASIFAGAAFGYQLLWVAPLAMLLGIIVLSAVAHQTLSTDENPFQAMKKHA